MKAYARWASLLVAAAIRSMSILSCGKDDYFVLPLSEEQLGFAKRLKEDRAKRLKEDPKTAQLKADLNLQERLHELLLSLVQTPSLLLHENKWSSPFQMFILAVAVKAEGGFIYERDLNPVLAKLKFAIRIVLFAETYQKSDSVTTFEDISGELCKKYIAFDKLNCSELISRLSTRATALVPTNPPPVSLEWSPDNQTVTCEGKEFHLPTVRAVLIEARCELEQQIAYFRPPEIGRAHV